LAGTPTAAQNGFKKDKKASLDVIALQGYSVETWIGF